MPAAPETLAPGPASVSPFVWMLRAGLGLRGLAGDLGRRWAAKPVTVADADDPDAAAKSVGAAAENELRLAAGAYRPLVPPGARAAYDRSIDEAAVSVNKQAADAFRARAVNEHETTTRATLAEADRALAAEHDDAIRDGDRARAETLAAQRQDLRRFTQAYLRSPAPAPANADAPPATEPAAPPAPANADAPPAAQPVSSDSVPTPASTEPVPPRLEAPPAPGEVPPWDSERDRADLRARIEADAAKADPELDPKAGPGEASWKKRVFALFQYVDHPSFDAIAAQLGLDPARARLVAALLTAGPADRERLYAAMRAAVSDRAGNIRDIHFYITYRAALDAVLRAVADPNVSPAQAADIRTSEALLLLSKQGIGKDYAEVAKRMIPGQPVASLVRDALAPDAALEAETDLSSPQRAASPVGSPGTAPATLGATDDKKLNKNPGGRESPRKGRIFEDELSARLAKEFPGGRVVIRRQVPVPGMPRTHDAGVFKKDADQPTIRYEAKFGKGRKTRRQRENDEKLDNVYDAYKKSKDAELTIDKRPPNEHFQGMKRRFPWLVK